jgi:hypothetical protein
MEIPDFSWLTSLISTDELRALLWILASVLGVVQIVKVILRYAARDLVMIELVVLSVAVSALVTWLTWPQSSQVHWVLPALFGGPLSNMLFWGAGSPLKRWEKTRWLWRMVQIERRNQNKERRAPGGVDRRSNVEVK